MLHTLVGRNLNWSYVKEEMRFYMSCLDDVGMKQLMAVRMVSAAECSKHFWCLMEERTVLTSPQQFILI